MDTSKRKGLFTGSNSKQMDVIMDLEIKKHRVTRGDCYRWNDLPNELLLHIFQYLSHGDLQQIGMVCKRWHYLAQLPEFLNHSKLVINNENLAAVYNCVLANGDEFAERLSILDTLELHGLDSSEELSFLLYTLGPKIRKLLLHNSPVFEMLQRRLPELNEITLSHIPIIHSDYFVNEFNLEEFKKLRSLVMTCSNVSSYIKSHMLRNLVFGTEGKMEKIAIEMNSEHEELLICALQRHSSSLKHIEIYFHSTPIMFTRWKPVLASMTQLCTLKATGVTSYFWLKCCFENLPKEAPLRHLDLSGGLQVSDILLISIIRKWTTTLEVLELMFCNALTNESILSLGFLKNSLRALNISNCSKINSQALLAGLVRETNYKLRSLVLDDIVDMDAEGMCLLMQRLPNLRYLSLESCRDAVTDETLAQIFKHQTKLQHLVLDDCMRISDEGLLGFGQDPAPIYNLKGLQSLSLRGCRNLSNRALTKGLKFVELRKLVLGYCHKISSMGIEELVENCPALEDLTISSCLMIDDDAMLHIAQGLPRLRRLNVSNCINLTGKSIDYVVELCKSLKELSMCGIDSLEIQEVQDKFFQMKPKIVELNL